MERKPYEHVHLIHHHAPDGSDLHIVSYNPEFALPILGYIAVEYSLTGWHCEIRRDDGVRRGLRADFVRQDEYSKLVVYVCSDPQCEYTFPGNRKGEIEGLFHRALTEIYDF